ncbi:uncharacterized protein LOC121258724 [Juglans microcarpa x Juglans regia]|uniref:uncharacterized protein LOC121258724 n=1 Tax=Juglans microcarpa x Juglans regia TaxID=2249226 RepID=UPI001B7EBBC8|nr:uncharacterized protein LOC121258724 [Juglans microcarpa x Juglans regia]
MERFREVLQDCKLCDLGYIGGKYTWANNRSDQNFTKERLDRAIANSKWCATFGGGEVRILSSSTSDHCPILVSLSQQQSNPFKYAQVRRYEDRWSSFSDCEQVIKKAWNQGRGQVTGLQRIKEKLQTCMTDLRKWSYRKEMEERGSLIQKSNRLQHLQQTLTAEFVQQLKQT